MDRLRRLGEKAMASWKEYGSRLILAISFLLVGTLSFEAGLLQKSLREPIPVIVRVADPVSLPSADGSTQSLPTSVPSPPADSKNTDQRSAQCQLVGSKNSNKYHHPASRCAKQIKPTNKVCFASVEAAQAKGYLPGCLEP